MSKADSTLKLLKSIGAITVELGEESPYCQIAGKKITAQSCLQTQGQEGCFGCAAPTRLCEECKTYKIAVAAVGLCYGCLVADMINEKKTGKPVLEAATMVECQLVNHPLRVDTCLSFQGEERCRNCSQPSRLCETCKERPSRYPQYGLCLHCAVEEYGEGWQPSPAGKDADQHKEDGAAIAQHMTTARSLAAATGEASIPTIAQNLKVSFSVAKQILTQLEEEGLVQRKPKVGRHARRKTKKSGGRGRRYSPKGTVRRFETLIPLAKNLILEHRRAGSGFFMDKLGIGAGTARKLLERLEKERIIGPGTRGLRRKINYESLGQKASAGNQGLGLTQRQKQRKVEDFIRTIGEGSEFAQVLHSLIADLRDYEQLKKTLRKIRVGG